MVNLLRDPEMEDFITPLDKYVPLFLPREVPMAGKMFRRL